MKTYPTKLERTADGQLRIHWSDDVCLDYTVQALRDACPCATCREQRATPAGANILPILKPEETVPLGIRGMRPIGNYAYGIEFTDGHDTGIYDFDVLRALGASPDMDAENSPSHQPSD